jgi:hypothetical protein
MQGLISALGLKELGLLVAAVMIIGIISVSLASASEASIQALGSQNIVAIAEAIEQSQPAIPYVWGGGHGATPGPSLGTCSGYTGDIQPCPADHTVGVDCSGFTRWVYSLAFGSDVLNGPTTTQIKIPQLHEVSAAAAIPGDLVFFGTNPGNVYHVGIYIGNGKMIDALKTGTNVETDTIFPGVYGYYHYEGTASAAPVSANLPKSKYVAIAQQDAAAAGIPADLFVRQINQESGFNPNAVSSAGAIGIAQFEPGTAAQYGIDPNNAIQSLQGAANLMASYYRTYGNYDQALAAYNAGTGAVNGAIARCGSEWLSCLPLETQNYVATILS